jgi:hypothetical protein
LLVVHGYLLYLVDCPISQHSNVVSWLFAHSSTVAKHATPFARPITE